SGTVTRPPGVMLDSGGLAKGLFADLLADELAAHASFAIDCAGDVRVGGSAGVPREVHVADPFGGPALHTYTLAGGGAATSGLGAGAVALQAARAGAIFAGEPALAATTCTLAPEVTEGPYWIANHLTRRDITEGKAGIPLSLHLTVVDATTCKPIKGADVEI